MSCGLSTGKDGKCGDGAREFRPAVAPYPATPAYFSARLPLPERRTSTPKMDLPDLWKKLLKKFRLVPARWSVVAGDHSNGHYQHSTSVLGLAFSQDDSLLALAGGGALPGVDGSVRLIDVATMENVRTLRAHVCGVHDVAIDPASGILASASYDYAVHLWDLEKEDVIFLRGEDNKTKGFCKFTREGSLLAIGEYAYYDGPHSFYVYSLKAQKYVFEFALPDEMGATSLTLSPDSTFLAVTASDRNGLESARLYLVQLGTYEIVQEHVFTDTQFRGLVFVEGHNRLIGAVNDPDCDGSRLVEIDPHSGEIRWQENIEGYCWKLACHPHVPEIAVGVGEAKIRIYDTQTRTAIKEYQLDDGEDSGRLCSLAYSNSGDLLAYGMSNGKIGIIKLREE